MSCGFARNVVSSLYSQSVVENYKVVSARFGVLEGKSSKEPGRSMYPMICMRFVDSDINSRYGLWHLDPLRESNATGGAVQPFLKEKTVFAQPASCEARLHTTRPRGPIRSAAAMARS